MSLYLEHSTSLHDDLALLKVILGIVSCRNMSVNGYGLDWTDTSFDQISRARSPPAQRPQEWVWSFRECRHRRRSQAECYPLLDV